jgi:hypothetical protein
MQKFCFILGRSWVQISALRRRFVVVFLSAIPDRGTLPLFASPCKLAVQATESTYDVHTVGLTQGYSGQNVKQPTEIHTVLQFSLSPQHEAQERFYLIIETPVLPPGTWCLSLSILRH